MISLTPKQQRILDIVQWVMILILGAMCLSNLLDGCESKKSDLDIRKEESYIKIYDSQEIESLKKENRSLYDSIARLKNVESAVEIKYLVREKTDTVYAERFVQEELPDSTIYHYVEDNDTVKWNVDICAQELKWFNGKVEIHDQFRIINVNDGDNNVMTVQHPSNVEVEDLTVWRKKTATKWYQRFHVGPQVGVGYGIFNNKPDVYVGVGVQYDLW